VSAGAPGRMVFDPPAMLGLAGTLSSAAGELTEAAAQLRSAVGGAGDLPPGILNAVQNDTASASRLLEAAADTYDAGSREVRRQAEQARRAGDAAGSWVPAASGTFAKITKHAGAITLEIDKHVNGGTVQRGARRLLAAKSLADLSGIKGLQTVLKFDDWRAAYRDAQIRRRDTPLVKLRETFKRRIRDQVTKNPNGDIFDRRAGTGRPLTGVPNVPANAGLRRFARSAAGVAPGVGMVSDAAQALADKRELQKKDSFRNRLAVIASGSHVASDVAQIGIASPFIAPAAVVAAATEAVGTVADVGVLAIDIAPVVKDVAVKPVELGSKAVGGIRNVLGI